MEETFPDIGSMSNQELKDLIAELTEEEREVSYRRRLLHGKIDELGAITGIAEPARVHGDHLAAGRLDQLDGLMCGLHCQVAADDQRSFTGKGQGGRATHAPARPSDDADLLGESPRHLRPPRGRPQPPASPPRRRRPRWCGCRPR